MTLHRTRGEACASDLAIDRMLAGELSANEAPTFEAHIENCARCNERVAQLRTAHAAFSSEVPRELAKRADRPNPGGEHGLAAVRSRRRWIHSLGGAVALAAALLFLVRRANEPLGEVVDSIERSKGSAYVSFHVQHSGAVRLAAEGEQVVPGDAIEFSYSAHAAGYLAIVSVDARQANVYFAEGDRAARIEAGREVVLPRSTVLDETLGEETVFALFCTTPVLVEPIRKALENEPSRAPSPSTCTVDRHAFHKVRP